MALAQNADILLYMDGDFSSLPEETPRLIDPIQADQADLVLGSRVLGHIAAGAMLPHQRFGNWLSSRLMSWLYHIRVTDLGPYRAIRATTMRQLTMQEMTFGWPTEMMVKVAKGNAGTDGRVLYFRGYAAIVLGTVVNQQAHAWAYENLVPRHLINDVLGQIPVLAAY